MKQSTTPGLAGTYARNLGAIPFGGLIVGILNLFTPLRIFEVQITFIRAQRGWVGLIFFESLIIFVVGLLQYIIQRPIAACLSGRHAKEGTNEKVLAKAKRRLLNLPFLLALVNISMFFLLPGIIVMLFGLFTDIPTKSALLFYFRALMIGLISTLISFFMVESHLRDKLIPYFFPGGMLAAVSRTMKISILRRIRVLYGACALNPMFILVGTLLFIAWDLKVVSVSPSQLAREILTFTLILCVLFILIALRLNFLVGRSILEPVGKMLKVMPEIRRGDFTKRIRVVSNDELGTLGDAGNEMIAGLLERERIRDIFGKYVTPEIRDEILAGHIPLNGERTEATLLFSDLRDFTRYVEANEPEEVIRNMRSYFTAMEKAITRHQGLILQYVGDEIEAVFGVPLPCGNHAHKAIMAALEMRKSLEELNADRNKEGKRPFRHGIGIHTGEVLTGTIGSDARLSYALVGDTVNLASRIQDLTKKSGCDILASEETINQVGSSFLTDKQEPQVVKGYSKPVTVYSVTKYQDEK